MYKKFATTAAVFFSLIASDVASAQVAVSVGIKEVYDDNVFLESGVKRPNAFVQNNSIEDDIEDGQLSILGGDPADGKENEDIISNLTISASGTLDELSNTIKGGWNLGTGMLLFTDYTDYSRLTLDALLDLSVRDTVIPKPFFITLNSGVTSQTSDVSVANGSSARAAQTWTTNFRTGIIDQEIAKATYVGGGYQAVYSKFLGEFVLSGNRDERFEQQGSDYVTNSLFANIDHQFTQSFNSGFSGEGGLTTFTKVESNDADINKDKSDLDRYFTNLTWDTTYTPSKTLTFSSAIGANITSLKNEPDPLTQTIVDENGQSQEQVLEREKTQSGLIYTFAGNYKFEPGSSIVLQVAQNRTADIDGDLITYRNFTGTLNKALGDRFLATIGSSFLQYSTGDSVANGLDRFEATTSLSYALTQDTNIFIGYNYADQDSDDSDLEPNILFQTQDYKSNRFFIGISSGIIGKSS